MSKKYFPFLLIGLILLIDQIVKIWIKLHLQIGEEIYIFDWFRIHFLENEGMAFGFRFGGDNGKLALSLLRLVAIGILIWYVLKLIREKKKNSLILSLSLILAGAIGNMIDCAFYGLLFSESYFQLAQFLPTDGTYAPFLHGRVVDMFYFPFWSGTYPSWFPLVGGNDFLFFRPVFNIADSSITIGFVLFFITQSDLWFPSWKSKNKETPTNPLHNPVLMDPNKANNPDNSTL